MPCEVCVSEAALERWRADIKELRAEVREERREQAELEGKVDLLHGERIQRIELERQNATLEHTLERRAVRERIAWSTAGAAVVGAILFYVLQ